MIGPKLVDDFCNGSFANASSQQQSPAMSATPPKADKSPHRNEMTRWANSRHAKPPQCCDPDQKKTALKRLSALRSKRYFQSS
jgi:hypothetical protein